MTSTRRRLAVVTTSTLALLAVAGTPAFADTSIGMGCNGGRDAYDASTTGDATATYSKNGNDITVNPLGEVIEGHLSVSAGAVQDGCGLDGEYTDEIVVRPGTSGAGTGTSVQLVATMRFVGDVAAGGTGERHYGEATAEADVTVSGVGGGGTEAGGTLARASVDLRARESAYPGTTTDASTQVGWKGSSNLLSEPYDHYVSTHGVATADLDTEWRSLPFMAVVGSTLSVESDLRLFATGESGFGVADVEQWEVNITSTVTGIVLDHGDSPQDPTPDPEPVVTPLDLIEQAREALAGYGLNKGIANSFDVKLRAAHDAVVAGSDPCDALQSFMSHLAALRGKKISAAQADEVGALVTQARELLGC